MIAIEQYRRPAFGRAIVISILCLAVAPTLPLVVASLGQESSEPLWTDSFAKTVQTTFWLGLGVSLFSLLVGLPLGLLASLYRFPARASLILFQAVPLLLPSFLFCIWWSKLGSARRF
jgi:ABC-type Fe3+ transport system permease subunit